MKITALHTGRGGKRVNIFLDGKFAFSVEAGLVAVSGLKRDQEISENQIETLTLENQFQRCYDAACRFLSYRQRSEAELSDRLKRRGFSEDNIKKVLTRLREQGLVNDEAFARFWQQNRDEFSPRSQRLTMLELKRKGVSREIINRVVDGDDTTNAYRVALKRGRRLAVQDFDAFRRRLAGYLLRRGFNYETTSSTVNRVWQEVRNQIPNKESEERG